MKQKPKRKKNRPEFIDDGRTIANMNVEGMRWYDPSLDRTDLPSALPEGTQGPMPKDVPVRLSKKERRAFLRAALWFSLKLALAAGGILFVLFFLLWLIWFH